MAEKPVAPEFETPDEFFAWRDQQRKRHRVMTTGEYALWCRGGDTFDFPTSSDCFRGGLTLILDGRPPIFGGFEDQ